MNIENWLAFCAITIIVTAMPGPYKKKAAIAHTAPIYITLKDSLPISSQPKAKAVARAWLASLDLLEEKFTGDNIHHLEKLNDSWDAVSEELLLNSRLAVMEEINTARAFFEAYLK